MDITAIWFSYRDDEKLLLESVKAFKRTVPEGAVTICDDGFYPISHETRMLLESDYGATYTQTFHNRNGNLIGGENFVQQLRAMNSAAKGHAFILKIDCDTLLLKRDWLEEFEQSKGRLDLAGSFKSHPDYPMGNCYALIAGVVPLIQDDAEEFPAFHGAYEDFEIGSRLHRINGSYDYAMRWRSGKADGFILESPYNIQSDAVDARVVSCGFNYVAAKDKAQFKRDQLKVMQFINAEVEKKTPPPKG